MLDLQSYMDSAVKAARQKTLATSDQLTLGEMILMIEGVTGKHEDEPSVYYDFGNFFPTSIDSWRGSYSELALNYTEDGEPLKISKFLELLKGAVGETFTGYKGGDFTMSKHTPIWVANYGSSGSTAVVNMIDEKWRIIIVTGYREY